MHISARTCHQACASAAHDRSRKLAAPAAYSFGSAPRAIDDLRQFAVLSENLSLSRRLPAIGRVSMDFYAQVNNLLNRVRFVNFDPNFSSASFGRARSTNLPRFIQLGARVSF